jgi:hypothetical protein
MNVRGPARFTSIGLGVAPSLLTRRTVECPHFRHDTPRRGMAEGGACRCQTPAHARLAAVNAATEAPAGHTGPTHQRKVSTRTCWPFVLESIFIV